MKIFFQGEIDIASDVGVSDWVGNFDCMIVRRAADQL